MEMRLLDSAGVQEYLGVGRNNFYKLIKDPQFPNPVRLYDGQKKKLWSSVHLDKFIAMKAQKAQKGF